MKKLEQINSVAYITAVAALWAAWNKSVELKTEREKLWMTRNRVEFQEKWIEELKGK